MQTTNMQGAFKDFAEQAEREVLDALDRYFSVLAHRVADSRERAWERFQERGDLTKRIENYIARSSQIAARMSEMEGDINRARLSSDYLRESELQGEFATLSEELQSLKSQLRITRESLRREFAGVPQSLDQYEKLRAESTLRVIRKADALKRRIDRSYPGWRKRVLDANH
jgi:chromosome segregation ATPase